MAAFLLLLPTATRNGIALYRLFNSKTTRGQYAKYGPAFFGLAIILSLVALLIPNSPLSDVSVLLNIMNVAVYAVGPIVSRVAAFASHPDKMLNTDETAFVCKARRKGDTVWTTFKGTVLDAFQEGYAEVVLWKEDTHYLQVFSIKENVMLSNLHQISDAELQEITAAFKG